MAVEEMAVTDLKPGMILKFKGAASGGIRTVYRVTCWSRSTPDIWNITTHVIRRQNGTVVIKQSPQMQANGYDKVTHICETVDGKFIMKPIKLVFSEDMRSLLPED